MQNLNEKSGRVSRVSKVYVLYCIIRANLFVRTDPFNARRAVLATPETKKKWAQLWLSLLQRLVWVFLFVPDVLIRMSTCYLSEKKLT